MLLALGTNIYNLILCASNVQFWSCFQLPFCGYTTPKIKAPSTKMETNFLSETSAWQRFWTSLWLTFSAICESYLHRSQIKVGMRFPWIHSVIKGFHVFSWCFNFISTVAICLACLITHNLWTTEKLFDNNKELVNVLPLLNKYLQSHLVATKSSSKAFKKSWECLTTGIWNADEKKLVYRENDL